MKNMKRILVSLMAVSVFAAGSITAMAADYESPADVVASLTGRPANEVIQERYETGKTYGMIADEAGMLDEFKKESLELKKEILDQNVSDGLLSQEEADEIAATIEAWQAVCNGTGYGAGFGSGTGFGGGSIGSSGGQISGGSDAGTSWGQGSGGGGAGFGRGQGFGGGRGAGGGRGRRDGSCIYYN